jgi:hypothetical protein
MPPDSPLKKARKQQQLDDLVFSVLAGFRQHGPMQWTDWHHAAIIKKGGRRQLSSRTFSDTVIRLVDNGRVQKNEDGHYEGVYGAAENAEGSHSAANPYDAETGQCGTESWTEPLKAEIAALRAENKRLLDWILGDIDALTCLQAVYQSPESSEYSKIKAAVGALPFERPKLSVAVSVRSTDVLGKCLDAAKMKIINPPKVIDHEA